MEEQVSTGRMFISHSLSPGQVDNQIQGEENEEEPSSLRSSMIEIDYFHRSIWSLEANVRKMAIIAEINNAPNTNFHNLFERIENHFKPLQNGYIPGTVNEWDSEIYLIPSNWVPYYDETIFGIIVFGFL